MMKFVLLLSGLCYFSWKICKCGKSVSSKIAEKQSGWKSGQSRWNFLVRKCLYFFQLWLMWLFSLLLVSATEVLMDHARKSAGFSSGKGMECVLSGNWWPCIVLFSSESALSWAADFSCLLTRFGILPVKFRWQKVALHNCKRHLQLQFVLVHFTFIPPTPLKPGVFGTTCQVCPAKMPHLTQHLQFCFFGFLLMYF